MIPNTCTPRFRAGGMLALLLLAVLPLGCGYPAAKPANLPLISSLRTALSARNGEWLRMNEEKIQSRHQAGEMGDDEHAAFMAIIQQARDGDWEGAEKAVMRFQRDQRPTREQIEQIRQRRGDAS
ncbi:MAG: hypothetical protein U1D30_20800 [Planctomycetota bacterium]